MGEKYLRGNWASTFGNGIPTRAGDKDLGNRYFTQIPEGGGNWLSGFKRTWNERLTIVSCWRNGSANPRLCMDGLKTDSPNTLIGIRENQSGQVNYRMSDENGIVFHLRRHGASNNLDSYYQVYIPGQEATTKSKEVHIGGSKWTLWGPSLPLPLAEKYRINYDAKGNRTGVEPTG